MSDLGLPRKIIVVPENECMQALVRYMNINPDNAFTEKGRKEKEKEKEEAYKVLRNWVYFNYMPYFNKYRWRPAKIRMGREYFYQIVFILSEACVDD